MPEAGQRRLRAARALAVLAVTALVLFVHRDVPSCALLGVDAYPQVLASRIESWDDFLGTFRETLTDRQITGVYYRPVQNLLLAANYAMGGLDPRPYQFTNWAALGCMVALLLLATAKMLGPHALLAPTAAAAFVALHPALVSIVHGPATRSEMLVVSFLLAALLVLPVRSISDAADSQSLSQSAAQRRRGTHWTRFAAAALFSLLAVGSKDTGAIAPLLVFVHQFGFAFRTDLPGRIRCAALATLPSALAVGVFLVLRARVVGGLGGYSGLERDYWEVFASAAPAMAPAVLCPGLPIASDSVAAVAAPLAAVLAAAGACAWLGTGDPAARCSRRTLVALGVVWALCSVPLMGFVERFYLYYAMFPLIGVALILAAAVDGFRCAAHGDQAAPSASTNDEQAPNFPNPIRADAARRGVSVVGAGLALLVVVAGIFASPLWHDYPQFAQASRLHRQVFSKLESVLASARAGQQIRFDVVRRVTDPRVADRSQPVASITTALAIDAWVRMRFPDRTVRVYEADRTSFPPPTPDAVALLVRYVEPAAFEEQVDLAPSR
jgi:hypothetical protein